MCELELKHARCDAFAVADRESGNPIRPYLTAVEDSNSTMIVFLDLAVEPPTNATDQRSLQKALECFRNDNSSHQSEKTISAKFPETIVVDDSPRFRSKAFEQICAEIGLQIRYLPVGVRITKERAEQILSITKRVGDRFTKHVEGAWGICRCPPDWGQSRRHM